MVEIKRDIIVLRVRRLQCKRFNCMELILFYHIDIHVLTLDSGQCQYIDIGMCWFFQIFDSLSTRKFPGQILMEWLIRPSNSKWFAIFSRADEYLIEFHRIFLTENGGNRNVLDCIDFPPYIGEVALMMVCNWITRWMAPPESRNTKCHRPRRVIHVTHNTNNFLNHNIKRVKRETLF